MSAKSAGSIRIALLVTALLLLLAACSKGTKDSALDETLRAYGSHVRWGEFEMALGFIDPKVLETRPVSDTDMERYRQIRMAGYREISRDVTADGRISQVVEIEFTNIHTQSIGSIVDRQLWRYDGEAKRWWLTTGLPDITAARR